MQRANSLLIALDNQHIEAVVANDWARSAEAEKKIHEVRTLRAEAVQAYRAHVLEHGC
jgi:hypothetical protein